MNFNILKIISKIHKQIVKKHPYLILTQEIHLWPSTYMQDKREIPVIVNEKIVIKCENFRTLGGGTSLEMALGNRRMN